MQIFIENMPNYVHVSGITVECLVFTRKTSVFLFCLDHQSINQCCFSVSSKLNSECTIAVVCTDRDELNLYQILAMMNWISIKCSQWISIKCWSRWIESLSTAGNEWLSNCSLAGWDGGWRHSLHWRVSISATRNQDVAQLFDKRLSNLLKPRHCASFALDKSLSWYTIMS